MASNNCAMRFSIRSASAVSHSQITITLQPRRVRRCLLFRSRQRFARNFARQKKRLFAGVDAFLQRAWRCQKHPWTKIAILSRGRTMSGRPGRSLRCKRNRKPIRCRRLRTASSGRVSHARTHDINFDRFSGVSVSMLNRVASPGQMCVQCHEQHITANEKNIGAASGVSSAIS